MKKIIDVGYLRDKKVEAYLKDDVGNLLVFNNYTLLEAVKGAGLYNMKKSLEIVAKYTNQIRVLKGIDEIMKVDYNSTDFRETFISKELTLTLQKFCLRVSGADDSDIEDAKDLLERSRYATECLDKMTGISVFFLSLIKFYKQEMDKDFLKYISTGKNWTIKEYEYVRTHVHRICEKPFKEIYGTQLPEKENILNHFIFRQNLCSFLLILKWVTEHGWTSCPVEKMRNDAVDMFYVVCATYFDGVLSNDRKINSIYQQAIDLIAFYENNTSNN